VNAWDGTASERYGDALPAAIVLSVVGEGMPLIYNGQEAGESKRLKFFERDPIEWQPHPVGDLYASLFALKKRESALWNGKWGARMVHVPNSANSQVLSFVRQDSHSKVFVVINFTAAPQQVTLHEGLYPGSYVEHFSGARVELAAETTLDLAPWGYRVYVRP
jgi:1,4-alpha-glucan branching enzyme